MKPSTITNLLPCRVRIQMSDSLANNIRKEVPTIGHYLNELHREELCKTMWWEIRHLHTDDLTCTLEAKEVIDRFCNRFNIELDIDINYDTLYKSWTRYKKRMEALQKKDVQKQIFFKKKLPQAVQQFSVKKHRFLTTNADVFIATQDLNTIAENYIGQNPKLFHTQLDNTLRTPRVLACHVFVYYERGQRTMQEIAKTLHISEKNGYCYLASFRLLIRKAPPVF